MLVTMELSAGCRQTIHFARGTKAWTCGETFQHSLVWSLLKNVSMLTRGMKLNWTCSCSRSRIVGTCSVGWVLGVESSGVEHRRVKSQAVARRSDLDLVSCSPFGWDYTTEVSSGLVFMFAGPTSTVPSKVMASMIETNITSILSSTTWRLVTQIED